MRHCLNGCQPMEPAPFKARAQFAIGCGRAVAKSRRNADQCKGTLGILTDNFAALEYDLICALQKCGIALEPQLPETNALKELQERLATGESDDAGRAGPPLQFDREGKLIPY